MGQVQAYSIAHVPRSEWSTLRLQQGAPGYTRCRHAYTEPAYASQSDGDSTARRTRCLGHFGVGLQHSRLVLNSLVSRTVIMLKVWCFLVAIALASASDVLEFTDDDFEEKLAEHDIILVEFFAPW